ncbi:MAG: phospholipase [Firmicutes bacterium]|nr:phospholipase [Bacillota bacterium]
MILTETAAASYRSAARALLATTSPIQELISTYGNTHSYCNRQAIEIMANDGWREESRIARQYEKEINEGSAWADQGWKNVGHYYNPAVGRGLSTWPSAVDEFSKYLKAAKQCIRDRKPGLAFFNLGAAAHLVQDLCVPHHSRNMILAGHMQYEKWVEKRAEDYLVDRGGVYEEGETAFERWAVENAAASYDWFTAVKTASNRGFHLVTSILLPQAQRSTAGFFQQFIKRVYLDTGDGTGNEFESCKECNSN